MNVFDNKPIVVPVDLSEESDRALDYAMARAAAPEQVTVLHVGASFGAAIDPPYIYPIIEPKLEMPYEKTVRDHFSGEKYRGIHIAIRYGDPGHEIAKFAKETQAGLIVMPSHGRTGLSHLVMGSVAERVVRYATCPVLVLRGVASRDLAADNPSEVNDYAVI